MKKSISKLPQNYASLLLTIKQRIQTAQVRTALAGNANMLMLYWEIGNLLAERQNTEGWGSSVLPRLAIDLGNELPEVKGFSSRNLRLMIQFFTEYPAFGAFWQPSVAKLVADPATDANWQPSVAKLVADPATDANWQPSVANLKSNTTDAKGQRAVAQLSWAHNIILIQKVKDLPTRLWYALQAFENVGPACRAGLRGLPRPEYTPSAKSTPISSGNVAQVRLRRKSIPAEWTYRLRRLST